ncbi:MAG: hypothetical protein KBF97_02400 [Bacteroidetes bacterium]|nr:hypothetical protein [Bacteroidota bacterium]
MSKRTLLAAVSVIILTITSNAQPLFYKNGSYMNTELGFYSMKSTDGTADNKKIPGLYGGWAFGLNPLFGFLSNVVGGDDPYLTVSDVLISDALNVKADFGAWPVPYNIMLGIDASYAISMQFGEDVDGWTFMTGPRVVGSSYGPSEVTAVFGVGYYGATLKLGPNTIDVTFPLSKAKEEGTWLFVHYHNIKDDADLQSGQEAGTSLKLGIGYEW